MSIYIPFNPNPNSNGPPNNIGRQMPLQRIPINANQNPRYPIPATFQRQNVPPNPNYNPVISQPQPIHPLDQQRSNPQATNNREQMTQVRQHNLNLGFVSITINQTVQQNMRININQPILGKMDGLFAQSFQSLKFQIILSTVVVFILLMEILLLYNFKVFKNVGGYQFGYNREEGSTKFSILPLITLFQSIIIILKISIFCQTYRRLDFALKTALKVGNSVSDQPANPRGSFEQNISQLCYIVETSVSYDQELQGSLKSIYIKNAKNKIYRAAHNKACCTHQIHQLLEFAMFVSAIYLIVALAQDRTSWLEKVILITTIVYWFLQNIRTIICTFILLLCPLITIGIIIYVFCCAENGTRNIEIAQAIQPTNEQIINSGGSCSICMMNFDTSDRVIILPCSDKHMFHELCIRGWLNLKTTCPICRYDLASNSH